MRKVLTGLCALALLTGLAAGCSDSDRVGENPRRDRTPSASPPSAPDTGGTMGSSPSGSPAPGSEAPRPTPPPTVPNR
jgi:hypothetical protein